LVVIYLTNLNVDYRLCITWIYTNSFRLKRKYIWGLGYANKKGCVPLVYRSRGDEVAFWGREEKAKHACGLYGKGALVNSPGSEYLPRNLSHLVALCWVLQDQCLYSIVLSRQQLWCSFGTAWGRWWCHIGRLACLICRFKTEDLAGFWWWYVCETFLIGQRKGSVGPLSTDFYISCFNIFKMCILFNEAIGFFQFI
jgi:hypothetical protein